MIVTLLLAAAVSPALPPPRPIVTARAEPTVVTVGDRVRVEIDVALPPGAAPAAPTAPAGFRRWGKAEVLATGDAQRLTGDPDAPRYRLHLVLAAFEPGEVELPPMPLQLAPPEGAHAGAEGRPEVVLTPAGLAFTVRSVLPEEGSPTPQPPAAPRPLAAGAAFWWSTAALALAAALAAGALLWRGGAVAAGTAATMPPVAPLVGLLRELESLRAESSAERLHTRLSAALRRFLASLLGIAAVERTTSEIDRELRRGPLAPETRRGLVDLLRRCDEVKFARRPASGQEAHQRIVAAGELAAAAERQLRPPEDELTTPDPTGRVA